MNPFKKLSAFPAVQLVITAVMAVLSAFNYEIFVFPNNFAPAGLNGIATMVQYLFGFRVGYLSLIINIPLLAAAFFAVNHRFSVRTLVFVLCFSFSNILFRSMDLTRVAFYSKDGGEAIMAAVAGGVFNGAIYSVTLRLGGSTGGTDIVAAYVNKAKPQYSMVWVIFSLNTIVAVASFFVYGMNFRPVILCIIYSFVTSRMNDGILKGAMAAAKFEVITSRPEELSHALMQELRHGCTVVRAHGMYSDTDRAILICVVNRHQVVDFERILHRFDSTFTMVSTVSRIYGNFKHIK